MKDIEIRISVTEDMAEHEVFDLLDKIEALINLSDARYDGADWMDDEGVHYHSAG